MSRPVVRSGSRGGPGRPPRLPAGRRGQRRAAAAARSVCGPEGKGKGRGDVEGEQVKSAGTVEAGGSEREGEGGRGEAAGPSRVSPPPGSPRPAPVLFAPEAAAAEGLSGGWGGDTGGAGGRAGPARTGAARGNGRGAEGPRRALFTSRRQSSRGCRGSASRAAVSVAVGPARRRPGGTTGCTPPFFYSHSPPALRRRRLLVPLGSRAAITICVCNKTTTTKKPWSSWKRPCPVSPPGSPAGGAGPKGTSRRVSWAPRAPRY